MAHSEISTSHRPWGHTETHHIIKMGRSLHFCHLGSIEDHPLRLHYSLLLPWICRTLVTISHNWFNRYLQHENSLQRVSERPKPKIRSNITGSLSHLRVKNWSSVTMNNLTLVWCNLIHWNGVCYSSLHLFPFQITTHSMWKSCCVHKQKSFLLCTALVFIYQPYACIHTRHVFIYQLSTSCMYSYIYMYV